jgi:hypothetical protein
MFHDEYVPIFYRKDDKSFAAISIRRRKKKGKCQSSFLNENWTRNHTT